MSRLVWYSDKPRDRACKLANVVVTQDFLDATGISRQAFNEGIVSGSAPEPIARVGNSPVWAAYQLEAWLKSREKKVKTTP